MSKMARKNFKSDHSSTIHFDSRTNTVMAQSATSHNHVKQKVTAVREVVLGKSFDEIVLVLQYYDYNSEKTIQAYLEDGANEALTQWHFSGSKDKKKKSKKGRAEEVVDNSSSNSTQNTSNNNIEEEKIPVINGDHTNDISSQASVPVSSSPDQSYPDKSSSMHTSSNGHQVADAKPQRNKSSRHKHSGHHPQQPAPPPPPKENHHSRVRNVSECSTASLSLGDNFTYKKAGLERSVKDLQRQTLSLDRLRLTFDSEMEKGPRKIKSVFEEVRKALYDREIQLIIEFENMKLQCKDVLDSRQQVASDLKRRIDNGDTLSEHGLTELRAEVKHFVSERRLDEDLAKTTRFMYAPDHILEEIKTFGEIVPLKQQYTTRRPSTSSVASSGPNHDHHPSHSSQDQHHHRLQQHHNPTSTSTSKPSAVTSNGIESKSKDDGNESDDCELTPQDLEDLQQRLQNSLRFNKGGPRNRPKTTNSDQDNAKRRPQDKSGKTGENRNRSPQKSDKKSTENRPKSPKKERDGQANGPRSPKKEREANGPRSPKKERDGQANGPRKEGENPENGPRRDGENQENRPRREGSGRGRGGRGRSGRGRGGGPRSPNKDSTANATPDSSTTEKSGSNTTEKSGSNTTEKSGSNTTEAAASSTGPTSASTNGNSAAQ